MGTGPVSSQSQVSLSINKTLIAKQRDSHISGVSTGFADLDKILSDIKEKFVNADQGIDDNKIKSIFKIKYIPLILLLLTIRIHAVVLYIF